MHTTVSLFKYLWTIRGGNIFNNAYYKNIKDKIVERNLQQELG